MNKVRFLALLVSICIILLTIPFMGGCTAEEEEVIELTFNSSFNPAQYPGKMAHYFADLVNERTNGRVEITIYASGSLSPCQDVYDTVVSGVADIGEMIIAYNAGRFPEGECLHMPYVQVDGWENTNTATDFYYHFQPESISDTHFFYSFAPGPYVIYSCKGTGDIVKPDDLKGKTVKVSGVFTDMINAYGGTPMAITINETYDAAAKGLIDIIISPPEALHGWNFADITESVTFIPKSCSTVTHTVMNLDTWNSLPDDVKSVFNEVAKEEMPDAAGKMWWYSDLYGSDYFIAKGGKIIFPPDEYYSAWVDPIEHLTDQYIEQANAAGLPGAEFVQYAEERHQYYQENHPVTEEDATEFVENVLSKY